MKQNMLFRRTKQKTSSKGRTHKSSHKSGSGQGTTHFQKQVDKFAAMAKSALSDGDRCAAENFWQHAEHYQRMLNDAVPIIVIPEETAENSESTEQKAKKEAQSEPSDSTKSDKVSEAIEAELAN